MQCPTVQIQIAPSEENPSGIVVINEEDYNAETMQLVGEAAPPAPPAPSVQTEPPVPPQAPATAGGVVSPPWANK